jgi:hypothetical protein
MEKVPASADGTDSSEALDRLALAHSRWSAGFRAALEGFNAPASIPPVSGDPADRSHERIGAIASPVFRADTTPSRAGSRAACASAGARVREIRWTRKSSGQRRGGLEARGRSSPCRRVLQARSLRFRPALPA